MHGVVELPQLLQDFTCSEPHFGACTRTSKASIDATIKALQLAKERRYKSLLVQAATPGSRNQGLSSLCENLQPGAPCSRNMKEQWQARKLLNQWGHKNLNGASYGKLYTLRSCGRRALSRLDFTKRTDRMSQRKLVGSQLLPDTAHRLSKAVFETM